MKSGTVEKAGGVRVALTGSGAEVLHPELARFGFTLVDLNDRPELVIAYGGDGSLLGSDRDFPDIPKLAIRRDGETIKCHRHTTAAILGRVRDHRHTIVHLPRVMALVKGQTIFGINDIIFHNAHAPSAVRYRVRIDGVDYSDEIVGDGLVVATPFGSSAYYRSITKSVFRVGLGLAFNNSTEAVNHLVLAPSSAVEVRVTRGPGLIFSDNMREPLTVDTGDVVTIRLSALRSEIWEIGTLTCCDCITAANGKPAGFRHV